MVYWVKVGRQYSILNEYYSVTRHICTALEFKKKVMASLFDVKSDDELNGTCKLAYTYLTCQSQFLIANTMIANILMPRICRYNKKTKVYFNFSNMHLPI